VICQEYSANAIIGVDILMKTHKKYEGIKKMEENEEEGNVI
jgi:hypothetical protein